MQVVALLALFAAGWRRSWRRRGDPGLLSEAARRTGVRTPWRAPKWVWRAAWRTHGALLPVLHSLEAETTAETCVNLRVLWLKALEGDDNAYRLLPRSSRWVVAPAVRRFYPRLHHANVAMRSAFLDQVIRDALERLGNTGAVVVVVLGAGYDTRSLRLGGPAVRWVEVDLPDVVATKRRLVQRAFDEGLPLVAKEEEDHPPVTFVAADLSNEAAVRAAIQEATAPLGGAKRRSQRLVFVSEALLIYLPEGAACTLLEACSSAAADQPAALCFADRLAPDPRASRGDVAAALARAGFPDLETYLEKPGLARHMGLAWTRKNTPTTATGPSKTPEGSSS